MDICRIAGVLVSHLRTGSRMVMLIGLVTGSGTSTPAQAQERASVDVVENQARAAWLDGSFNQALSMLEEGLQAYHQSAHLLKLQGDILTTIRQNQEALQSYESVLAQKPGNVQVRWAKWSVLTRLGEGDSAIQELEGIVQHDPNNPLIHLRLAQELRKLDRLEESLEFYRQAVQLSPNLLGWRLALARARFDILDYEGARKEVEGVLQVAKKGSPVEAAGRNLLMVVYGATKERGRRFQPIYNPEGTGEDLKRWGLIRNAAWKLFTAGRYREAEPVLREIVSLRPSDQRANYDLGVTLMELDRFKEAIDFLQKGIELGVSNEVYLDSLFRIGQCLAKLERWEEAGLHFQILLELAAATGSSPVESQDTIDEPPVIAGAKMLDKQKVDEWLKKVQQHVPDLKPAPGEDKARVADSADMDTQSGQSETIAVEPFPQAEPVHPRASLMGRDADFSWFRFVIPAGRVMRDDLLMGSHEYIPIDPGDTFFTSQKEINLVFALVTASYDEVPLTAECFLEASEISTEESPLLQDRVVMAMNEQSGYFRLRSSPEGWQTGLYRCGLFVGDTATAYNHADEVRFRIIPKP